MNGNIGTWNSRWCCGPRFWTTFSSCGGWPIKICCRRHNATHWQTQVRGGAYTVTSSVTIVAVVVAVCVWQGKEHSVYSRRRWSNVACGKSSPRCRSVAQRGLVRVLCISAIATYPMRCKYHARACVCMCVPSPRWHYSLLSCACVSNRHFIDKYTQVARILKPIVLTVQWVTHNYETKTRVEKYVDHAYGGLDNAIKLILCDFFRFAFDGSGADNFYDAGSCNTPMFCCCCCCCLLLIFLACFLKKQNKRTGIDGRLTRFYSSFLCMCTWLTLFICS